MTSVSAGHIVLTPTQPVGSGRPQRESNPGPPHKESRALPTELPRPPPPPPPRMQIDQHISMTHIDNALTRNKSISTKTKQTRLSKTPGKHVLFVAMFSKSGVSKPQSALSSAALTSKELNIIFVHLFLPLLLTICSHVIKSNVYLVFEEVYTEGSPTNQCPESHEELVKEVQHL